MGESEGTAEIDKREPLTDRQMENLISSLGNSESKAITLLTMKPGVVYTNVGLSRELLAAQGDKPGWIMDHNGSYHYLSHSFEPIGLVAVKVEGDAEGMVGYVKTKYGSEVGDPLAGLLLDYSLKHPTLSLYSLFGSTLSSSKADKEGEDDAENMKRAVGTRLKIFWELATADLPIRVADLGERLGEDPVKVASHLVNLDRLGVVNYEAIKFGEPFTGYKLTKSGLDSIIPALRTDIPNNLPALFKIFSENQDKWLTTADLQDELVKGINGSGTSSDEDRNRIHSIVNNGLTRWLQKGYLETRDFNGAFRSIVDLDEEQRQDLTDVLDVLERFQNQNPGIIEKGLSVARELTPEQKAVLMEKAKKSSPFADRKTVEDFADELSVILKDRALNAGEITKIIQENGERISQDGVRVRLVKLERRGVIERPSKDKNAPWSLKKGTTVFSLTQTG